VVIDSRADVADAVDGEVPSHEHIALREQVTVAPDVAVGKQTAARVEAATATVAPDRRVPELEAIAADSGAVRCRDAVLVDDDGLVRTSKGLRANQRGARLLACYCRLGSLGADLHYAPAAPASRLASSDAFDHRWLRWSHKCAVVPRGNPS
jgi:hypothetical protein